MSALDTIDEECLGLQWLIYLELLGVFAHVTYMRRELSRFWIEFLHCHSGCDWSWVGWCCVMCSGSCPGLNSQSNYSSELGLRRW